MNVDGDPPPSGEGCRERDNPASADVADCSSVVPEEAPQPSNLMPQAVGEHLSASDVVTGMLQRCAPFARCYLETGVLHSEVEQFFHAVENLFIRSPTSSDLQRATAELRNMATNTCNRSPEAQQAGRIFENRFTRERAEFEFGGPSSRVESDPLCDWRVTDRMPNDVPTAVQEPILTDPAKFPTIAATAGSPRVPERNYAAAACAPARIAPPLTRVQTQRYRNFLIYHKS
uniref:Uncharacterized protein n=1 Tax=Rhodosorus marinus TaxID=101924 RepID=A0A7S0G5J1_9RHOD|mmetsp:Transcript_23671/g.34017  ORF Transcript_23671/g.34017 Transcript_23671/m.34017 type:complete len:231 (+) Transcript_23671:162-854(+)|eukprot:CAMPEP_0184737782 /NCGR_PEP_ID=MMETSP0315-20130426/551_1 /TAXON_ID=101924 /ORGANISM="Rhodosorus marinus, Strain UTEX LB 2760" /LENGTH=230 /DNA_ID=CAMNT_0027205159 /DNA_START=236 /DNA_END=928 /DNA_ORIENTATION=-